MNELTFLDLVILKKLDAESTVENFGSGINTSFFETANLIGTLKIKGYVNIESSVGGISKVVITDAGKGILALADKKASEPIEPLDSALLHALAGGAKDPEALQSTLNIRSGDLAYHINKMVSQEFMDYDVRAAKASLMLTEQGFNSTGGMKVQGAPAAVGAQPAAAEGHKKEEKEKHEEKNKDDIFHILRGVEAEEKKHEHKHHEAHKHAEHEHKHAENEQAHAHMPGMSEEEKKKHEKGRRLFSKLKYYAVEYWAWILLIIVAVAVFAGAVYSMVQKIA